MIKRRPWPMSISVSKWDWRSPRNRFWLKKEKPKMRALIQRVHQACRIEGLPPPHRSTIQRRVDELDALGAARRRGEVSLEAEVTPSAGRFHAERPNDVWQIDHTIVDLIVVDEETRLPIGRPFLTLAVDICARMVAGLHLSLDAPSSASVASASCTLCTTRPRGCTIAALNIHGRSPD